MNTITIGGREIPLFFSTYEVKPIQKEICNINDLNDQVFGYEERRNEEGEMEHGFHILDDGEKIERFGKLVRILGNAGLEEDGKEPDLTEKWILRRLKYNFSIMDVVLPVLDTINEGMKMENTMEAKEESGPVDEGLKEIERAKKAKRA